MAKSPTTCEETRCNVVLHLRRPNGEEVTFATLHQADDANDVNADAITKEISESVGQFVRACLRPEPVGVWPPTGLFRLEVLMIRSVVHVSPKVTQTRADSRKPAQTDASDGP